MTKQEYLEQNLAGFENDIYAKERMKELITGNEIRLVIETGTYLGSTTKHFAEWCEHVHTIEVNETNYNKSLEALNGLKNVSSHFGSSEKILDRILETIDKTEQVFIFLDAHWGAYNPLLDELAVIAKHEHKPIIAIHDFKVPGRDELGYDVYENIIYDWAWIEKSIETIYGKNGFVIEYNSKATGAKRGIIYIMAK